jgi:hypothetical protein
MYLGRPNFHRGSRGAPLHSRFALGTLQERLFPIPYIEGMGLIGVCHIEEVGLIGVSNIEEVGLIHRARLEHSAGETFSYTVYRIEVYMYVCVCMCNI